VGGARAVCLGLAAAIGYALTAALMKSATDTLDHQGVAAFFSSWQTYGFATVGVCALFLLENAMQAGPLVASQPALTLGDALVSLSLGVTLYNETVRVGWWLIPEVVGVLLVALGAIGLSRLQMRPQEGDAQTKGDSPAAVSGTGSRAENRSGAGNASGPGAGSPGGDRPGPTRHARSAAPPNG
jgi:hypothetical protein